MMPPDQLTQPQPISKPLIGQLKSLKVPWLKLESLLLSGALIGVVGLILTQPNAAPPTSRAPDPNQFCQEIVQPEAVLSREQLAQILTVPERDERSKVQNIVKEPYCRMPSLSIRAGATTERDAYPLEFDPQTWLIILYEGGTYVGYGFKRS